MKPRRSLARYAWLSVAAALVTMAMKTNAYLLTGSVGLLSDALESGVNLAAALLAMTMLSIRARPPDEEHAYGHEKAEYFSSGAEGALILIAAGAIAWKALERLENPVPIQQLDIGVSLAAAASAVNFGVAAILLRVGKRERSIALEADARHLLSDVWTSAAVLLAVGVVALTGWTALDPLIALGAAAFIAWSGFRLVRRSTLGLMDTALPAKQVEAVEDVLRSYATQGLGYHALRTRQSGARSFVSVHIQVPGSWSVQQGHDVLESIERDIRAEIPEASVFTHIEPMEDPLSWRDQHLDRHEPVEPPQSGGR